MPPAAVAGIWYIDFTFPLSPTVPTAARTYSRRNLGGPRRCVRVLPDVVERVLGSAQRTFAPRAIVDPSPLTTTRLTPSSRALFAIATWRFISAGSRAGGSQYMMSNGSVRPTSAARARRRSNKIARSSNDSSAGERRCRASGAGIRQGHPSCVMRRHPTQGELAVSAEPQGRVRSLHRRRIARDPPGRDPETFERHRLAGPRQLHGLQGLVEERVAYVEVDAQSSELRLHVPGTHAQFDPSARQRVERGHGFGQEERIAIRHDGQIRQEPERRRRRGDHGQTDEGIERVVTARLPPSLRRRGMLGQPGGGEA